MVYVPGHTITNEYPPSVSVVSLNALAISPSSAELYSAANNSTSTLDAGRALEQNSNPRLVLEVLMLDIPGKTRS